MIFHQSCHVLLLEDREPTHNTHPSSDHASQLLKSRPYWREYPIVHSSQRIVSLPTTLPTDLILHLQCQSPIPIWNSCQRKCSPLLCPCRRTKLRDLTMLVPHPIEPFSQRAKPQQVHLHRQQTPRFPSYKRISTAVRPPGGQTTLC